MAQLFDWLKTSSLHPLIKSCVFHYEFEFIHPFADGNGRTGRLWQTLILQKWQPVFAYLPVESMILSHQQAYYAVLNAANTQGDCTGFIVFMLEMIRDTARNVWAGQSHIQQTESPAGKLLMLLKAEPELTIPELADSLCVSERQVRRVMAALRESGKLDRQGSNKKGRWIVTLPDE